MCRSWCVSHSFQMVCLLGRAEGAMQPHMPFHTASSNPENGCAYFTSTSVSTGASRRRGSRPSWQQSCLWHALQAHHGLSLSCCLRVVRSTGGCRCGWS